MRKGGIKQHSNENAGKAEGRTLGIIVHEPHREEEREQVAETVSMGEQAGHNHFRLE